MDKDDLTGVWTAQVRERIELKHLPQTSDTDNDLTRTLNDAIRQQGRPFIEAEISRTVPFALSIGERDGATGPLTDPQLHEADLLSALEQSRDMLRQTGEQLQSDGDAMPSWKKQFAESLLDIANRPAPWENERSATPNEAT